jgi:hypothetical protein
VQQHAHGKKVRYVSPGRLAQLEQFRSDLNGQHGGMPTFAATHAGHKHLEATRHNSSGIVGDLMALHGRADIRIKVEARLKALFRRQMHLEWSQAGLEITFASTDAALRYPASREASGLLHLVSILAAAFDDDVGVLLLDEPEISLHPQLQAYLLGELRRIAGDPAETGRKLVIISTHSPSMLDVRHVKQLSNMVFFQDLTSLPRQIAAAEPQLRSRAIGGLLARMGETHRVAFFAQRLLLVEGPSDEIIANALASRFDLPIDAAGTQIVPVIGKGEMPAVRKLFALIGKESAILADLDALVDDAGVTGEFCNIPAIDGWLQEHGHRNLRDFSGDVRNDLNRDIDAHYADLQALAERHPYWVNRDQQADPTRARRRAGTAVLLSMDITLLGQLSNSTQIWRPLRTRVLALLDALERGGCFILRRGALESYSMAPVDAPGLSGKPEMAVAEADLCITEPEARVREVCGDVIRALEYVARKPRVDEAGQIRALLLAALAPCLDNCTSATTNAELNQRAAGIVRDWNTLFAIENATQIGVPARLRVTMKSSLFDGGRFPVEVSSADLFTMLTAALPSA